MKTLSLIAALMIAAPAHAADMPINKEPHINHVLLQGFIGDAIADNCPTMEPRKLRALGELNKLRAYAQDKGYSVSEIRAFVTDDTEKARGKAEIGNKTMLDVLGPVAAHLESGQASFDSLRALAAESARATIPMKATRGRASFLGDRSIGHMDPGARSSEIMIIAVCDVLEGKP